MRTLESQTLWRRGRLVTALVLAVGLPSLGLAADDHSLVSLGAAPAFPDLFSEQYPMGLSASWLDQRGEPAFDRTRLTKAEQDLYRKNAGIYFPKKFGREPIASHLLQLSKSKFTWGEDFYLFDVHGAVDYSTQDSSFLLNVGSGWFNPIPPAQVSPAFFEAQGWYRISSPAEPMAYLKNLVKEKLRKNLEHQGAFPTPTEAMKVVGASYPRVLEALKTGNHQDLLALVSKKRGLELTNLWWTGAESTRLSYDELRRRAAEPTSSEPGLWSNQFFPLMVKALFEYRSRYRIYPNLFVDKDIEAVLKSYGRSIVLEFQFYAASSPSDRLVTNTALNLIFVPEDGDWKLCALELFVDLR